MRRGGWGISDWGWKKSAALTLISSLVLLFCAPAFLAAATPVPSRLTAKTYQVTLSPREQAWIKAHPNIRLGIDPEFAPFEFLDKTGHYKGIAADYVRLLRKRLGLRLRVVPDLSWPEVMAAAQNGGIDVLACVGKTTERQRFLVYSRPYLNFNRVIITRARTPFISSIDEIYSWRVAVQAESSHAAYLREHTSIIAIPYATLKQALISLSSGQTQALVGNVASSAYWINHLHLSNLKIAAPVNQGKLYFAVRRDWPILADIINKGLASINHRQATEINQRWVRIDIQRGVPWRTAFVVLAIILGLGITGMFFNHTLRRQVTSKTIELRRELTERERSQAEAQRANEELRNLNSLLISCAASLDMRELFDRVMDGVSKISGLEGSTICFVTPDQTLELAAHRKTSPDAVLDLTSNVIKVGDCLCGNCARDKKPLILWNRQEVIKYSTRETTRNDNINFHAAFPLLVGKNCIGVLCVFTRSTAKPEKGLILTMEAVAAQVALAMHSSRLYEETVKDASLLEEKVMVRTRELEESQAHLQETVEHLNTANEKLRELDQLKSLFIASTSHELRTPLNSIIGFSAILRDEWLGPLNEEQKLNLAAIHRNGRHLLALINDIIDISKIEAGKLEGYVEDFRLDEVVDEALDTISAPAKDKGLELRHDVQQIAMRGDRRRLLQCLLNLLTNAVKFTSQGTITISGTLENRTKVRIVVTDTGIGIREEDVNNLFRPFVRLHAAGDGEYPGTGLGLYLTAKLVREVLGGEISLTSVYNQGTTFTMLLPVEVEIEVELEA